MNTEYQFSLGDLTYTIRKLNGLTQVDYSKRLGVVQSTVSKVEKDIFDDVPFSLVCKISSEFNIPINYFQAGILPLRKNQNFYKAIPKAYIADGIFRAKTIYFVLKELKKSHAKKLFKDLKLSEQFLCLSNLTYSLEFVDKLYSLVGPQLLNVIEILGCQLEKKASGEFDLNNIYQHLAATYGIELKSKENDFLLSKSITFSFQDEINERNEIYASLLKLELELLFGCKIQLNQNRETREFELVTVTN